MATTDPEQVNAHAQLAQAYQQSLYRVYLPDNTAIDLRPGQPQTAMDAFLQQQSISQGHVITACNPCSQVCSREQNQNAMLRLQTHLEQSNWASLPAQGQGLQTSWPAEASVFVLGLPRNTALQLAEIFQQYAVLEHVCGQVSRLLYTALWTRDMANEH